MLLTAYCGNLKGVNCRVFQDMGAALDWLTVSSDLASEDPSARVVSE
jgi:hypothetical protein